MLQRCNAEPRDQHQANEEQPQRAKCRGVGYDMAILRNGGDQLEGRVAQQKSDADAERELQQKRGKCLYAIESMNAKKTGGYY